MSFRGNPIGKEGVREITLALNGKSFHQLQYLDLQNIGNFSLDSGVEHWQLLIQSVSRHGSIKCLNLLGLCDLLKDGAMRDDLQVLTKEEQLRAIMLNDFIAFLATEEGVRTFICVCVFAFLPGVGALLERVLMLVFMYCCIYHRRRKLQIRH